jgi:HEAT repeat protein
MNSPQYWELDGYLKIDNSFLQFINEEVFFSFNKHFQEYPTTTALIFSVFLIIGITGFLFLYVIHLRLKFNRYQKLKARKFVIWEQNFLPLILDEADISTLIKTIKKSEYDLFGEFIAPYLNDTKGDSLARIIGILREIGVAKRERHHLKHSNSTWRRALAVQRLGILKDPSNIQDLTKALHDKEITVALNAAGALLKMRDSQLMKKVVSVLLQNELITEELFAEVLLKFEKSMDLETLLSKEIDKYPMPSRFKIFNLIEPVTKIESGYNLINHLKNSKKAISIILEDEDLAEELLGEIIYQYQNNKSIDLDKILSKKEKEFPASSRIKIIDFIGYIKRVEGVPVLIDLLKNSKNDEETISVIKALGNLEAEEAMPQLLDRLKSDHPVIRAQSAKSLGAFKDERTAEPISRLLEDRDWWCRFHAASSIHQMGEVGKRCLQNFLKNTNDPFAKGIIIQFLSKPQ